MERICGTEYIVRTDPRYPRRMRPLAGMPKGIYVRGNLPEEDRPSVAIVGARSCSNYGRNMAREFARILSDAGVQIISGLALGIDGEAHTGALCGRTATFAVLANDVNQCYPRANRRLYDRILERGGGILGEQPPGTPPLPGLFPARNRIISALADLVLVVEARAKSGSLITVDCALEQGRGVFAVPGRVGDLTSEGCNRLIAQGAGIACSPEMLLQELKMDIPAAPGNERMEKLEGLSELAREICAGLGHTPVSLEELCARFPCGMPEISAALLELQLAEIVTEISKNYYAIGSKFQ